MKTEVKRSAICIIILCIYCIQIPLSAIAMETEAACETASIEAKVISDDRIKQLSDFLTGRTKNITQEFDINSDKRINAIDLTLLKRQAIVDTKLMQIKSSDEETNVLINEVLKNVTLDTQIPKYSAKDGYYENVNNVYLFKSGKITYAYTVLSNNTDKSGADFVTNYVYTNGIHVWKYTGSKSAVSVNDPVPGTTGKSFVTGPEYPSDDQGIKFTYNLATYSKITYSDIKDVAEIVVGATLQDYVHTKKFDYNVNGLLDKEDLQIMIKYATSNPYFFFPKLNRTAVNKLFNNLLNQDNMVVLQNDISKVVDYAYSVSTGEINNSKYEGVITDSLVQVLPLSELSTVSSKYGNDEFANDNGQDFIVWEPEFNRWAYGSNKNTLNWKFGSGLYVYVLNQEGKYRLEWVK